MTRFVGLDVSQRITALRVIDDAGRRLRRGQCPTNPEQMRENEGGTGFPLGIERVEGLLETLLR
jgi:hypothetical protein